MTGVFRVHFILWMAVVLLLIGGEATGSAAGLANSPSHEFEAANKLYEEGKFKEAAIGYQQLINHGLQSATVYYNLGNAWYKAGQSGRAIAAYLNAERLAPRDPSVRFNLAFLRGKVNAGKTSAETIVERSLRHLSVNEWTLLAAVAFWITMLLLAAGELRLAWRAALRGWTFAALGAALLLCGAACAAVYDRNHIRPAVVISPEVVVRYGPLDESKAFYNLPDGAEVRLIQEQPANSGLPGNAPWAKVEDASGRQGWLKRDQIVVAAPKSS